MNRANDKNSTDFYLNWLADYLHRPKWGMPSSAILSVEEAFRKVMKIEIEIASWMWDHPFEEYPPEDCPTRHWDFLHRVELSKILSRVPKHEDRQKVLRMFYEELIMDSTK